MKYLFLPGNSKNNKDWINKLSEEFSGPKSVIHYDHWETGEDNIDFNIELEKISQLKNSDEYVVVAKSAGCVLALMIEKEKILNIKEFFFIGFPMSYIQNRKIDIEELLRTNKPITFVQKMKDPQIGFEDLKKEISNIKPNTNFVLYHKEGEPDDNHYYEDTGYLYNLCSS
ncbi:MAG: hypothetical protein PHP08_02540 [Candidatus Dojkabacteria bacterium]|nr:hypothetical protein [Candidatus Dojkabacteria bacterium]